MKVGDYVRTKYGLIMKIEKIERNAITTDISLNDYSSNLIDRRYLEEFIIKSSPNIIDLIEVGDYVNGYKVSFVDEEPVMGKFVQCDYEVSFETTNHYIFYETAIKSIVTKEQFESMEYRTGE
jgi:hypothetical protein